MDAFLPILRRSWLLGMLWGIFSLGYGQGQSVPPDTLRVVFYNVENLFDCQDDPLKDDSEFLPGGMKNWTPHRYRRKLIAVSKVLAAVGENRMPDLVGLCEVENDSVIRDLTRRSPLRNAGYQYVVTDSPDERGVDVALLYLPGSFRPLSVRHIPILGGDRPTRDILHVSGLLATADTLDVFVCHLPSRYGGSRQSEPFRMLAANVLRQAVDSVSRLRQVPRTVVMGDFNDDLSARSSAGRLLGVRLCDDEVPLEENVLYDLLGKSGQGSYAYQGRWELIDHLLVSAPLLQAGQHVCADTAGAFVYKPPFLLENDEKYGGKKPFRTHLGGRYLGGYSDHLPVVADFVIDITLPPHR